MIRENRKKALPQREVIGLIQAKQPWPKKLEALKEMGVAVRSIGGDRPRMVAYVPGRGWTHLVYYSELQRVA